MRKSLKNAIQAFDPVEHSFRLEIKRFNGMETAYRDGTADESVITQLLKYDDENVLRELFDYMPQKDHVLLDVGSHIGVFTLFMARRLSAGKVYAIEACHETYNLLRINVALNHFDNVVCSHLALADHKGETRLHYSPGNWGHSIMKRLSTRGEVVPSDTLENYFVDQHIKGCDFIKFNCEGAEFPILLGASKEVLRWVRKMLILYHCDIAEGYELGALTDHLKAAGFALKFLHEEEKRGWIVATQIG